MIRSILILFITSVFISSCSLDDTDAEKGYSLETLPVKSSIVPSELEFGSIDTITIMYDLPSGCHHFYNLYYEYEDTSRIVAVNSLVENDPCNDLITEMEYTFNINVSQSEDYIFKFWKGVDSNGNNIFEEITVPVVQP